MNNNCALHLIDQFFTIQPCMCILFVIFLLQTFALQTWFLLFDPQLLLFLKAFSETEQTKLAMLSGILLGHGTLPATILTSLFTDSLVKEGNCSRVSHLADVKSKATYGQRNTSTSSYCVLLPTHPPCKKICVYL